MGAWTRMHWRKPYATQASMIPPSPHLGPRENIGGDCEGRMQFGDEDVVDNVSDFCEKHGITDEEWNEIQDKIKGEESTDAVYLER